MLTVTQAITMQVAGALCSGPIQETITGWGQYSGALPPSQQPTVDKLADLIVSSFGQRKCPPFRSVAVIGHADKDWHGAAFEKKVSFERAMTMQRALTAAVRSLWAARNMGPPPVGGVVWEATAKGSTEMIAPPHRPANRRVVVILTRSGAPVPPPPVADLVSPKGTPINPTKMGRMINIFGERETEQGFENYTTDPKWARGGDGVLRPWTADPSRPPGLGDNSASDICVRSSPLSKITLDEMERIAKPGARITVALNSGPSDDAPGGTNAQLEGLRKKFPGATILFDGVHQGKTENGSATDWKVIVMELP